MLPLPPFELHSPSSLDDALALLARFGSDARISAGGTDLLPNMKNGLAEPRHLVSLKRLEALYAIRFVEGDLVIGAMATLDVIATSPLVLTHARAIAEAADAVGGPHHRRMGTLGGNLCLDTRCRYYNQSEFWREALGYCLKKDGDVCHVVPNGRRCVATASNDTAPAAIAIGASIVLASPRGERTVLASEFYTADGVANTVRTDDEIVTALRIPIRAARRSGHDKLRHRAAIDYPLLSLAACVEVDADRVESLTLVVSALASRPRRINTASHVTAGIALRDVPVDAIAERARSECHPLETLDADVAWRREMVGVHVRRLLTRLGLGAQ
jgi:4-hydroxybenzoyl-CoA reductase subunit beta